MCHHIPIIPVKKKTRSALGPSSLSENGLPLDWSVVERLQPTEELTFANARDDTTAHEDDTHFEYGYRPVLDI